MKRKVLFSICHLLALSTVEGLLAPPVLAQASPTPAPASGTSLGKLRGLGPLGDIINKLTTPGDVTPASSLFASILSNIIGFITIIAGLYFMIQLLLSGFEWITSSGNPEKLKNVQGKITNSIIGLVIVIAAYAITSLVGKILGINILDIGAAINVLGPK